jgi:hypothetical protein
MDFLPTFLKVSAIPSTLIPFFSGWTLRGLMHYFLNTFDISFIEDILFVYVTFFISYRPDCYQRIRPLEFIGAATVLN